VNDPAGPVRPARPHQKLTDDGRRMREVLSYSRRGNRFTPSQADAWERYAADWVIPDEAVDDPGFTWSRWFGREAPLVVEIGPGVGEATGVLAAGRPDHDVLALEVWRPGVAAGLAEVAAAGATNVRFCSIDAAWVLEHLVAPDSLAGLWTFFPDPWPKTRHHKRRLVDGTFAALAASRLARGAEWRLATDWADYAEQMREVLDAEPTLEGGPVERWAERPVTRFERKGLDVGREISDFCYRRCDPSRASSSST
jgi:tRNA (guanine-N7-)-methyltransferase